MNCGIARLDPPIAGLGARLAYLASLCLLQVMSVAHGVPLVAHHLQTALPLGTSVGPGPFLAVGYAVASVVGATLALGYPALALMRHVQRGEQRYRGLPRWCVVVTIAGAAMLGAAELLRHVEAPSALGALGLQGLRVSGAALAVAGSLCGELLRRSVAVAMPWRARTAPRDDATGAPSRCEPVIAAARDPLESTR